ncbi:MAG TPA: hypothetical protein VKB38_14895 [Terracidiphilus sp.]|nr:hypothetical protein [Terracidiphilus sp.]
MKPQKIGRVLGVGVRVAGRMAGERLAGAGTASVAPSPAPQSATMPATPRNSGVQAGRATGSLARGLGGFFRPFRRVGGIVFLEVTGVFFLLFVLVFGTWAWRLRASYAHGPDHLRFLVYAGMMLFFLYLSASSFWRARRK